MTILAFPSAIIPSRATWRSRSNTQTFVSPLSNTVQSLELPGTHWYADLSFPPLKKAEKAAILRSFLMQLRGAAGRFRLYQHPNPAPLGVATGSPLVNDPAGNIAAGDNTIPTDGWTISTTGILLQGSLLMVNDELKMLTADADSNGSGEATLQFEPPLRSAPADNAIINLGTAATAIMRLVDDEQTTWSTIDPLYHSFTISCVEAFT